MKEKNTYLTVLRFFTCRPRSLVCVLFLDGVVVLRLPLFLDDLGFSGVLRSSASRRCFSGVTSVASRARADMLLIVVLFMYCSMIC